jgi:ABC-type transporter Mla subunit MlaD
VGLAVQVDNAADQVVRERARLESAATGMHWKSTAASSFARRVEDGSDLLRRDVDRLEELAAALRAHARHVEEHLQVLANLERRAQELAAQGVNVVTGVAGAATDVATAAAGGAVDVAENAADWVGDHLPW